MRSVVFTIAIAIAVPSVLACAASPVVAGPESEKPQLDLHAIVFLSGVEGGSPTAFQQAEWSQAPSDDLVARVFPSGSQGSGYADLDCKLAPDRSLTDCTLTALDPDNASFRGAFLRLVEEYRLDRGIPIEQVSFVNMIMRLHKGDFTGGPCGPFCVPTPPPPPPPPPPKEKPRPG